jgi:hypothetical protein
MFWDNAAIVVYEDRHLLDVSLRVLEEILTLDSEICQQSSLHGLGEIQYCAEERVAQIIDTYLQRRPLVSSELRKYAMSARQGDIL